MNQFARLEVEASITSHSECSVCNCVGDKKLKGALTSPTARRRTLWLIQGFIEEGEEMKAT